MTAFAIALLVATALDLDTARELPWRTYVESQIERADDRVLPPPPDIAVYFGKHVAAIEDLRRRPALPIDLPDQMLVTRILVAHGLSHHDWEDLHAAWKLDRGLWKEPHVVSILTALAASRTIGRAARKLPPPAPPWLNELQSVDARRALYNAFVREAERIRHEPEHDLPGNLIDRLFRRPYEIAAARDYADAMLRVAAEMAKSRRCVVDEQEFERRLNEALAAWNVERAPIPNLSLVWQRVAMFTREREETIKTLELKSGLTPSATSQCSDGSWIVNSGAIVFRKRE